jgi:dsRNA-specific ribonuclease
VPVLSQTHLKISLSNQQLDALPLTPVQESSLQPLLSQFHNRNVLIQFLTHPSMFVRPSLTHPMAYEEAQGKLGRLDYLKFKVLGYSLLKFVLTAHLFHCNVKQDFQLASIGRVRSVEGN